LNISTNLKLHNLLIVSHFHSPYSILHSNHSFSQTYEQNIIPLRERLRDPSSFFYKRNSIPRGVKRPRRKDGNSTHVLLRLRMHGATPPVPHSTHGARFK